MNNSDIPKETLWGQIKQVGRELFRGGRRRFSGLAVTLDRQAGMQKLAARIRGLGHQRQQLLLTMGRKAYSLHRRGKVRNRDILADCLTIDELEAEIGHIQARIEEIRRQAGPGQDVLLELEDEAPVAVEEEPPEEVLTVTVEAESVEEPAAEQTEPAEAETIKEPRAAEQADEPENE